MIIRPEQFEAFNSVAEAGFIERIAHHLRQNHADVLVRRPDSVSPLSQVQDEALRGMIQVGLARAREYGMTWESSLMAFVAIMFVAAPNFDQHPLIGRVLKDEAVAPDARINQLWERTTDQNWEAVAQNYDPSAWDRQAPGEMKNE